MFSQKTSEAKRRNIAKRRAEGINVSCDVFAFRMGHGGLIFVPIVGLLTFALISYVTRFQDPRAALNAALFSIGLFWLYRAFVPTRIYVRVKEIIRYRYTLLTLELAGVGVVVISPAFLRTFSKVSRCSLCLTLSVVAILTTLWFFRRGDRRLLFLSFFLSGALAFIHPVGLAAIVGVVLTQFYIYLKCNTALRLASTDDAYGSDYRDEMSIVFESLSTALNSMILASIALALGVGLAMGLQSQLIADFTPRAFLTDYFHEIKGCITVGMLLRSLIGGVLALFAVVRSRRLSDISEDHSMGNSLVLSYGVVFVAALVWPMGIFERMPFFSNWSAIALREQSFLPDVLASVALLVSATVFVVELCCREDIRAVEERSHGVLILRAPSRFRRKLRAGAIAAATLAIVLVALYRQLF